jgi:hypothetical protein
VANEYVSGVYVFNSYVKTNNTVEYVNMTITQIGGGFAITVHMTYNSGIDLYEYEFDTSTAPDGTYSESVEATDGSGNKDTAVLAHFHIDNTNPTLDIVEPHQDYQLVEDLFTVEVRSYDVFMDKVEYKVDAGEWLPLKGGKAPDWTWSAYFDTTSVEDGPHIITIRSTDLSGKVVTENRGILIDNEAPKLFTVRAPPEPDTIPGVVSGYQNFSVRASDKVELTKVIIFISVNTSGTKTTLVIKGEDMNYNPVTGLYDWAVDLDMFKKMDDGRYNWTITAYDIKGHSSSVAGNFVVLKSPPEITICSPAYEGGWNEEWRSKEIKPVQRGRINISLEVCIISIGQAYPVTAFIKIDDGSWLDMNTIIGTEVSSVGEYYYIWDTTSVGNGMHLIQFKAVDFVNNTASDQYVITVKNDEKSIDLGILFIILAVLMSVGFAVGVAYILHKEENKKRMQAHYSQQASHPGYQPAQGQSISQIQQSLGSSEWKKP